MAGGAQAKISTWFSKPNQSLISKVTKKKVVFNMKIFVFALLKPVQNRAERNSGRILRLFICNDRGFLLLREAPKPKCLPGLISPITSNEDPNEIPLVPLESDKTCEAQDFSKYVSSSTNQEGQGVDVQIEKGIPTSLDNEPRHKGKLRHSQLFMFRGQGLKRSV